MQSSYIVYSLRQTLREYYIYIYIHTYAYAFNVFTQTSIDCMQDSEGVNNDK